MGWAVRGNYDVRSQAIEHAFCRQLVDWIILGQQRETGFPLLYYRTDLLARYANGLGEPSASRACLRQGRSLGQLDLTAGTPAYVEEDARNVWEAGNAAFARNWTEGRWAAGIMVSRYWRAF